MKIKDCTYRGFNYSILFADRGDWGKHLHHFYTECPHNFDGGMDKDIDVVSATIQIAIDDFLATIPNTVEQLVDLLSNHLVWDGYEDCHLDTETSSKLISAYLNKHFTKKETH